MKKIVALTYCYFYSRKLPTPYFRTIMTFVVLIIFQFLVLYAIFPIPRDFIPFGMNKTIIGNYLFGSICFGILYFIVSSLFKKKSLEQFSFTEKQAKKCLVNLGIYFVILVLAIITSSALHLRNKW